MELEELRPGLWRWTERHPDWEPHAVRDSPADWPELVGSVLHITDAAAVFVDPLLPARPPWARLDRIVRRRRVHVLTTIGFHRRSRDAVVERYAAATSRARRSLPAGVDPFPLRRFGETVFWLPGPRALVPGDRLLGGRRGGLRLCPESWLRYLPGSPTQAQLREALRPLLELPVQLVLVSHGRPVLRNARAALARALEP
jgi:hypothetical protein